MRLLHVGIFQDHELGGDIVFQAGFLANGVQHQEFEYRSTAKQIGIAAMNEELVRTARDFDVVFVGKGEIISPSALEKIRKSGIHVAIYYGDIRSVPDSWLTENLHHCDTFFMSSGGATLRQYYESGRPAQAAYYLNPANPELAIKYQSLPRSISNPLFTGTPHKIAGKDRMDVYKYLCHRKDIDIVGSPKMYFPSHILRRLYMYFRPVEYIRGKEYIERIIAAKFGIGVSAFQNVSKYSSDRLSHYLTFGKLYLAYRFLNCESLFEDGHHLVFYNDIEDLARKIEHFLHNQDEAESIGQQGQERMLSQYNSANMVRMMLDIMTTGKSTMFPWVEIISWSSVVNSCHFKFS